MQVKPALLIRLTRAKVAVIRCDLILCSSHSSWRHALSCHDNGCFLFLVSCRPAAVQPWERRERRQPVFQVQPGRSRGHQTDRPVVLHQRSRWGFLRSPLPAAKKRKGWTVLSFVGEDKAITTDLCLCPALDTGHKPNTKRPQRTFLFNFSATDAFN